MRQRPTTGRGTQGPDRPAQRARDGATRSPGARRRRGQQPGPADVQMAPPDRCSPALPIVESPAPPKTGRHPRQRRARGRRRVARTAKRGGRWPGPTVPSHRPPAMLFQPIRRSGVGADVARKVPRTPHGLIPAPSYSRRNCRSFGSYRKWSIWPRPSRGQVPTPSTTPLVARAGVSRAETPLAALLCHQPAATGCGHPRRPASPAATPTSPPRPGTCTSPTPTSPTRWTGLPRRVSYSPIRISG